MYERKIDRTVYIIKLKGPAAVLDPFRGYLLASEDSGEPPAYYNLKATSSASDNQVFDLMEENAEYRCAFLDYVDDEITCLYWTTCNKYTQGGRRSIHCRLRYKSTDKSVIENFVYNLQLSLEKDFPADSYINYEISVPLLEQMRKFEKAPFQKEPTEITYEELDEEKNLSPLAQKNQYCCRKYNFKEPQPRGEFQRDYDRIVYSKAFRRMVDKAQIFSSVKGDHYRTRMTHTLIVCQIAQSISRALKLNSPLAEAIAAGHDLGHTPFGHQGERTLHAILTGKPGFEVDNLAVKSEGDTVALFPYGGFKHNYQSVRVATNLEAQYLEIDGLDLSEQTLNGMWMHTGKKGDMEIGSFSDDFLSDAGDVAFTLEGQVVAVADEIAQRSHDIDDAFASRLIKPSDFVNYLELKKSTHLKEKLDGIFETLESLKLENRLLVDEDAVVCAQISSIIVNLFIEDVCAETKENMDAYSVEKFNADNHRVYEQLVCFSDAGKELCRYLDNIISKRVINSHEVTLFDQNGSSTVLALFRAYYKAPSLLHAGTLQRIWNEYRMQNLETIDFKEGKPELVKSEWNKITTTAIPANDHDRTDEQRNILRKRIILVRGICDFISGMTDSYALNEYRRIVF